MIIAILLIVAIFGVGSEPAESGAVYVMESGEGLYKERLAERWFLFVSNREGCKVASYRNGELDRCMKVDEAGQLYGLLNAPVGSLVVSESEVRIATQNGLAVFKRSAMSFNEAMQYSGQSDKAIARRKEAEEREREEKFASLVAANNPPLTKLIVDSKDYLDKPIVVHAFCDLGTYYNYGYTGAQDTHYSVGIAGKRLSVSRETIYVFFNKKQFPTLPSDLGFSRSKSTRRCKVGMVLRSDRYEDNRFGSQALFEGTSIEYLD